jgi:hypothetical protein
MLLILQDKTRYVAWLKTTRLLELKQAVVHPEDISVHAEQ